jgi:hypothetical protein
MLDLYQGTGTRLDGGSADRAKALAATTPPIRKPAMAEKGTPDAELNTSIAELHTESRAI